MTPDSAHSSILEDLSAMAEGDTCTFPAAFFEAAFQVMPSAPTHNQDIRKPILLAETGFRMQFPMWTCTRTLRTYIVTKPRRNPYAAKHGNH